MTLLDSRPDRDGQEQFRLLGAVWEETARQWQDEVARLFEAGHWIPLARQSSDYLEALAAMMDLLETAERETEFLTALFLTAGRPSVRLDGRRMPRARPRPGPGSARRPVRPKKSAGAA